jgi:hypothetical protein
MPWMLQPKNYIATMRPNLYNVAYRRVGAYKGMGQINYPRGIQRGLWGLGQASYVCADGSTVTDPSLCSVAYGGGASQEGVTTQAQALAQMSATVGNPLQLPATAFSPTLTASGTPLATSTGLSTGTMLLIAGGVVLFVIIMMAAKK